MTLYLIGLGLFDQKDVTVKGFEAVKKCDYVYLENYTSVLSVSVKKLEEFYGKKIILADRDMVEKNSDEIINNAFDKKVAFLVVGDVFGATTHADIFLRTKKKGINVEIIHNASVLNAVGITGLELYKFGKTTSIPFPQDGFFPQTPYDVIKQNQRIGLHTLVLLDIKVREQSREDLKKDIKRYKPSRFMSIKQGIMYLLEIEKKRKERVFNENTLLVGCARLGSDNKKIVYKTAKELLNIDFGSPLHCIIVPGKLHFIEEEALALYE